MASPSEEEQLENPAHASLVALNDRGLLIIGPSGSGKSALALQLVALGADLVADDRTCLTTTAEGLYGQPPQTIAGRIEARGLGILALPHRPDAPISAVVDMGQTETDRLPEPRDMRLLGHAIPAFRKCDGPGFAPALFLFLRHGDLRR